MTELQCKQRMVYWCLDQVGYTEGADNWNKYAQAMDTIPGLTWGPKQNLPWCGTFELAAFVLNFGVDVALEMLCSPKPTGIPLCKEGAKYFKDAGQWNTDEPELGDVAYFYVNGGINHVGIVVGLGEESFYCVEGNSADKVSKNWHCVYAANVAGFGRPKWAVAANVEAEEADETDENKSGVVEVPRTESPAFVKGCSITLPLLQKGDVGNTVQAAQTLLIGRGFRCGPWGADGEFGAATYGALYRFQRSKNLEPDGVIGPMTWAALLGVQN